MTNLAVKEIKAFVPAKDHALSKRFYQDMGFTLASDAGGTAYLHYGSSSFLLQDFYVKAHADNFMMHLQVEDVQAWWQRLAQTDFAKTYGIDIQPPVVQPWGMIDFVMEDPSGVLWRIGQNTPGFQHFGKVEFQK